MRKINWVYILCVFCFLFSACDNSLTDSSVDENSISPTITGHPDDYLHYCEPRIMTVRECARIQSFPDWYQFKKKYTTGGQMRKLEVPRYTQVGNAIPPLFAELAGVVLKQMLIDAR